jgi:hypothetical protein
MPHLNTLVVTSDGVQGIIDAQDYLRARADDLAGLVSGFPIDFKQIDGVRGAVAIRCPVHSTTVAFVLDLMLERCFHTRFEIMFEGDFESPSVIH